MRTLYFTYMYIRQALFNLLALDSSDRVKLHAEKKPHTSYFYSRTYTWTLFVSCMMPSKHQWFDIRLFINESFFSCVLHCRNTNKYGKMIYDFMWSSVNDDNISQTVHMSEITSCTVYFGPATYQAWQVSLGGGGAWGIYSHSIRMQILTHDTFI